MEDKLKQERDKFWANWFSCNLAAEKELSPHAFASKPVKIFDLSHNYLRTFPSLKNASQKMGISKVSIWRCIQGKTKSAGGFIWEYAKG